MKPTLMVVLALALLIGAVLLGSSETLLARQDSKEPDTIETLREALDQEREARLELENRVQAMLEWIEGLDKASGVLENAANQARENGFEYAAPNPQAKTDIIEGLKGFASTLLQGRPKIDKKNGKGKEAR